ncbi:unnamed protein product [Sphenostylis stenocarpa]|uniref:Uncharacterized protein n=1 Tax=Sphenostylis stenocarpa TaxID=92480 RepID=A0AA86T1Q1_9FABA|nr:unnamed protein product [Sphenostylis stenocarpa]
MARSQEIKTRNHNFKGECDLVKSVYRATLWSWPTSNPVRSTYKRPYEVKLHYDLERSTYGRLCEVGLCHPMRSIYKQPYEYILQDDLERSNCMAILWRRFIHDPMRPIHMRPYEVGLHDYMR